MDIEKLKALLYDNLSVVIVDRRGEHICVRCPYCGDSDKQNEAHLAIKATANDSVVWHCVRCDAGGLFNMKLLEDLKIADGEITELAQENEKVSRKFGGSQSGKIRTIKTEKIFYDHIVNKKSAQKKLDYMNKRFKRNFTFEELIRYSVIFDFKTMIKENNLRLNGISEKTMNILHKEAIGFASINKSMIIFRNIDNNWENRYFNYTLNKLADTQKYFAYDKKIDSLCNCLNVVLCEGSMDLIGVIETYYQDKKDDPEWLFISCSGKSYKKVLSMLRNKGFFDLNLFIYADNDTDISLYRQLKYNDPILKSKRVEVYLNAYEGEKDFGVSSDRIKRSLTII